MNQAQQPYMYDRFDRFEDDRFPTSSFDPKAVTRASWEPKPATPKHEGPLVSFNRHPDAHEVRGPRGPFKAFGPTTKWWIKSMRILQLALRVVEMIAAAGILFFMIVITEASPLTAWVMRITAGAVLVHCVYGIFHLARPAGARPPASAAGYQIFSAITDLTALPLYAFGALSVHNSSEEWATILNPQSLMDYFLPSLYYSLIGGGALHVLSLCISLWLALKFRQIVRMPPDCNPLEENLTSRQHKRNKSSVATMGTLLTEDEKRLSTPHDDRLYSGLPHDDLSRPPSIPFHATRSPRSSFGSADFPVRQYQITPGNSPKNSPRNSATAEDFKRISGPPASPHSSQPALPPHRSPWRGSYSSYAGVPTLDPGHVPGSPKGSGHQSRPSTGSAASHQPAITNVADASVLPRPARFTESWYASESLVARTQERNRAINAAERAAEKRKTVHGYESLSQPYDTRDLDYDSEYENEDARGAYSYKGLMSPGVEEVDENDGDLGTQHPNPLRSNPSLANAAAVWKQGNKPNNKPIMHKSSVLSEIDLNDQRVNGGSKQTGRGHAEVTDEKPARGYGGLKASLSKRYTWAGSRNRDSSIQPETNFYSKPYGELRSSTPPVIIGSDRQVSSGNDLDLSGAGAGEAAKRHFSFGRRNVSGKVAEEGRGIGWAR